MYIFNGMAFTRNLLQCNSDFKKKSRVAANLRQVGQALCGTGTALWMCRIPAAAVGTAQLVAHEKGKRASPFFA